MEWGVGGGGENRFWIRGDVVGDCWVVLGVECVWWVCGTPRWGLAMIVCGGSSWAWGRWVGGVGRGGGGVSWVVRGGGGGVGGGVRVEEVELVGGGGGWGGFGGI